jgi:2-keto-3-deoxy-galactonokinase
LSSPSRAFISVDWGTSAFRARLAAADGSALDAAGAEVGATGLSTRDRRGAPDVMRGEETQILGPLSASGRADGLFVLPGAHSKWARVEAGRTSTSTAIGGAEILTLSHRHCIDSLHRFIEAAHGQNR